MNAAGNPAVPAQVGRPLVSVIIPAYNRKDDLPATLASVLDQDFRNFEVIVVDDGSSDGTAQIDFPAIDRRVRMVRHLVNRGGSAARNTGIDAARGGLVAFLDSDDQWDAHKLRAQIDALAAEGCIAGWDGHEGREVRVVEDFVAASNVTIVADGSERLHNMRGPAAGEALDEYLMIEGQALQTSTMLLPTALARRVRFRDGLKRHQDWDFAIRFAQAGARLVYSDQPLANYCLRDDPQRISRQKGRLRATLDWYRISGEWPGARAMQTYFLRSILSRDALREPLAVMQGLWWLARRSRKDAAQLVRLFLRESADKFRGWRMRRRASRANLPSRQTKSPA